jgi:hypothetical protein
MGPLHGKPAISAGGRTRRAGPHAVASITVRASSWESAVNACSSRLRARDADEAPQALLRLTTGTSFAIASSVVITSPKNSRKLFSVAACSSSVQVALPSDSMVTR